jgi:hypothetical protein
MKYCVHFVIDMVDYLTPQTTVLDLNFLLCKLGLEHFGKFEFMFTNLK